MAPTVVLITGANRGIGLGILKLYLARPNHIVIATVRDVGHESAKKLGALPRGEGTSLVLVKIEVTVATDPAEAVKVLSAEHGINHIDILVANAGIALKFAKVSEVTLDDIQQHADVNVHGFVLLYQAFLPMLQKAKQPKWVTIGSGSAYLTVNMIPMKNAAYAPTKLVQHWLTKAMHLEEPWLTAFPVDPGWVQTDLGNRGADAFGYEKADITVDESVDGVIKVIDAAARDTHGGKMWVYKGEEVPW